MASSTISTQQSIDLTKTLIRSVARTLFTTRQTLILDALLIHSVLHADDLAILLSTTPKDVRRFVGPLRTAKLVSVHGRMEARAGATRGVQREYYYVQYHLAIDSIKYKMMALRRKVETLYKVDVKRKDMRCPRCKAEWEMEEVLDNLGPEGYECHRCGSVLDLIERREGDAEGRGGSHEKIGKLNMQLGKLDALIEKIDRGAVPENRFEDAWERKRDVPRGGATGQAAREYVAVGSGRKYGELRNRPGETDVNALNVQLTSGEAQLKEEAERKERERERLRQQNQLPEWHKGSAIGIGLKPHAAEMATVGSSGDGPFNGPGLPKKEGEDVVVDDKKPASLEMQSALDAYLEDLKREQEEEARKAAIEDAETPEPSGEDDEFEDIDVADTGTTSAVGTPAMVPQHQPTSSAPIPAINGIKRDRDFDDDDSVSGPSSDANTPAAAAVEPDRDVKRVKLGNGGGPAYYPKPGMALQAAVMKDEDDVDGDGDSEEDEEFENAM